MAKKAAAHHGGAWKVAYADFVTAMMALFMVLWISAQDQKIVLATSKYFQNPFHSPMNTSSGVLPFSSKNSNSTAKAEAKEPGTDKEPDKNKQIQMTFLNSVAADVYRLLHLEDNYTTKSLDLEVTTDGLRVTLFDRVKRPLFLKDTAEFTEWGNFVLQNLAWTIDRHHFRVEIDGHAQPSADFKRENYSGWELSADRANAARRLLVHYAVEPGMIDRVVGFSDTKPLPGEPVGSEANQRITLSLSLTGKPKFKDNTLVDRPIPVTDTSQDSKPTS